MSWSGKLGFEGDAETIENCGVWPNHKLFNYM